nr:hypothetical protein [Methanobrevibacter arboriphilus]
MTSILSLIFSEIPCPIVSSSKLSKSKIVSSSSNVSHTGSIGGLR